MRIGELLLMRIGCNCSRNRWLLYFPELRRIIGRCSSARLINWTGRRGLDYNNIVTEGLLKPKSMRLFEEINLLKFPNTLICFKGSSTNPLLNFQGTVSIEFSSSLVPSRTTICRQWSRISFLRRLIAESLPAPHSFQTCTFIEIIC